ncbi:prepilin-type N-terminal cleavage/methylation domain-containing protein [Planctomycetales bacterium ZRK34]|nr:prepilin-type N-terminal cleavage/methylation domain-containing protein [Planctomycetales bacterium ZRK34]
MRRQGFTLIELLVVVSIIALLIAILLPSLSRAREVAKRSVCAAHLHEIGTAATMYTVSNKGNYIPCARRNVQLNITSSGAYASDSSKDWSKFDAAKNWIGEWERLGTIAKIDPSITIVDGTPVDAPVWDCPSREFKTQYQATSSGKPVITTNYSYFGGITKWYNPSNPGGIRSRSPVTVSNARGSWVLATDSMIKIDYAWGQGSSSSSPYAYVDLPSHKSNHADGRPEGGNQVYVDGSAGWVDFKDTIYIHSWSTNGSRAAYMYQQDLGEYDPPASAYGY